MSSKFPKTFNCPKCGSDEPVSRVAMEDIGITGVFTSMSRTGTPLLDTKKPPTILAATNKIKSLVPHQDYCYNCGAMYISKFEIIEIEVSAEVLLQMYGVRAISQKDQRHKGFDPRNPGRN